MKKLIILRPKTQNHFASQRTTTYTNNKKEKKKNRKIGNTSSLASQTEAATVDLRPPVTTSLEKDIEIASSRVFTSRDLGIDSVSSVSKRANTSYEFSFSFLLVFCLSQLLLRCSLLMLLTVYVSRTLLHFLGFVCFTLLSLLSVVELVFVFDNVMSSIR